VTKFPYNDTVLEHFKHPHNVGELENPDGKAIEGSPACGDMVSVTIKVNPDTQVIEDIKFQSYGCASNIATGSIITDLAKGKTVDEAKKLSWKQASDALGGLPPIKAHCSVLAIEGLRASIRDYQERHGLIEEREPTTVKTVEKRLRHVMNPLMGLDIVRTDLVKDIAIQDGTVRIVIDLDASHQYAAAIKADVAEKIEPLWDVERVEVEFTAA
jgi:NifU-like protein involved in Fe-S cluster formation/metal-sulfur cluster biosynthetic enzyme